MMRAFDLAATAFALALPAAATAQQVPLTGRTTADAAQIRGAMQEIVRFSGHHLKCSKVDTVEATILAEGWQPADPNFRIGPPGTRYERWGAAQCGRVEPFLVGFWVETGAGGQFQVAHPYPAEPGTRPKP